MNTQSEGFEQRPVHIMGLGWLGQPLATSLQTKGVVVSGSVTSEEKQQALQRRLCDTDLFDLYANIEEQKTNTNLPISARFRNAVLVLNIPPGRRAFDRSAFVKKMISLIDYAMQADLHKLIFISTTSVYGALSGSVDNDSIKEATTESGKAHAEIEAYLHAQYLNQSKILRPSGLVGPNPEPVEGNKQLRHPIFTLCHKSNIPNAKDPVNLVHQLDVIQSIEALIQKQVKGHGFNLCSIDHPSRKEYYQWCAKQLSLPIPSFAADTKKRQLGKLIDAQDTYTALGIKPIYPSPFDML